MITMTIMRHGRNVEVTGRREVIDGTEVLVRAGRIVAQLTQSGGINSSRRNPGWRWLAPAGHGFRAHICTCK